jgi:hypothetical protein
VAGCASATLVSRVASAAAGLARPEASTRALSAAVGWLVGPMRSTASSSNRLLEVKLCSGRAELAKLMTIATSSLSICSIISATLALAKARRVPLASSDCMLAELSMRKISRSSIERVDCQFGRNSAMITNATNRSCNSNSRLERSRCQRLLTCRSSIVRCQR